MIPASTERLPKPPGLLALFTSWGSPRVNGPVLGKDKMESTSSATPSETPSRSWILATSVASSPGVETFSSPRLAASISIILRRSIVFSSPKDFMVSFTKSMVARSMQMLVAVLSERDIMRPATSRMAISAL